MRVAGNGPRSLTRPGPRISTFRDRLQDDEDGHRTFGADDIEVCSRRDLFRKLRIQRIDDSKQYLKQETLTELEKNLDPQQFIRIHRSYLLNVDRLTRLDFYTKDNRVAILSNGVRLPVSKSGYTRLKPIL